MMILSCNKISKTFVTDVILDNVSFQLNANEKTALVGINGAGKSTLFKIITGKLEQDSGKVIIANQITLGYLAQNTALNSDKTIYEEILSAKQEIINMEKEIYELEKEIAKHHDNEKRLNALNEKYTQLRHTFEMNDGYSYKSQVKGVLKGLGFTENEFNKSSSVLSGGQKTRLALAKILISAPELLLLDEPTNHLDIRAIEWLENYLLTYNGTLLIISHDRYFLDKIVTKVIEIENGKSTTYNGNYSFYIQHKTINKNIAIKHYQNQQKEIKKQEEIIKQLRSFNREKTIKRAESREKTLNKIEKIDKPITLRDTMHLNLDPRVVSGHDVLQVKNLQKSFAKKPLFKNATFNLYKGDKVALIGNNGTGKSTIFKIIMNQLKADQGIINFGSKVYVGYYDQEHANFNPENNLIEEISDTYPRMPVTEIRNVLAAFLFTGDDVFKLVDSLSGGEKGRLTLAKLMLSKSNFLLLDEPTNHLDVVSKEILETALTKYTGTIFFISHDRYFINQVATRVLELTESGINNYLGNYDYYIEKRVATSESVSSTVTPSHEQLSHKEQWLSRKAEETKKRKLQRELEKIEEEIHTIEEAINNIDARLCLEEVYTDHIKAMALNNEKLDLETKLHECYEKWDELS